MVLVACWSMMPSGGAQAEPAALARACEQPVPRAPFEDVAQRGVHGQAISCLLAWGITKGVNGSSYAPSRAVTRAQMATFLARLLEAVGQPLERPPGTQFDDVGGVHRDNIAALAAAGIAHGTSPSTFDPGASVTRAQMATFLMRTANHVGVNLPEALPTFVDVSGGTHGRAIGGLAEAGVVQGRSSERYDPTGDVTRAQMASFLMRTADLLVERGVGYPPYLAPPPTHPDPDPDPESDPGPEPGPDPDPIPDTDPEAPEVDSVTEVVGAEGGRVELGAALVEFPPGAVADGTSVTLTNQGIGDANTDVMSGNPAVLGPRYQITASQALESSAVVTLPVDLSKVPAEALDAVFIHHQSEGGSRHLEPAVDTATGRVIVTVEEFSWFQPSFDLAQRWLLDASDRLLEWTGVRTEAPRCNEPPADHYEVSDPGAALLDPWLKTCVEAVDGQLELRARNNRTYAMRLEPDGAALTHHGAHDTGDLLTYAIGACCEPPLVLPQAEQRFRLPPEELGNLHYTVDWPATMMVRVWASLSVVEEQVGALKWSEAIVDGIDCVRGAAGASGTDAARLIEASNGCIDAVVDVIPDEATWHGLPVGTIAKTYGQLMFVANSTGALYDLAIDSTSGTSGPLHGTVTANISYTPPDLTDGIHITHPDRWEQPHLPFPNATWTYAHTGPRPNNRPSIVLDGGQVVVGLWRMLSVSKYFEMDLIEADGGVGFRMPSPLPEGAWQPSEAIADPGGDLLALGHDTDGISVVRFSPNGNIVWKRSLDWPHWPSPHDMALGPDGELYIGSTTARYLTVDVDTGRFIQGPETLRSNLRFGPLSVANEGLVSVTGGGVMKVAAHAFDGDESADIDLPADRNGNAHFAVDEDGTAYIVTRTDVGGCQLVLDRVDIDWTTLELDLHEGLWSAPMRSGACASTHTSPDWAQADPEGGMVLGWSLPYDQTLNITRIAPDGTVRSQATLEGRVEHHTRGRSQAAMAADGKLYVLYAVAREETPSDRCGTRSGPNCRDARIVAVSPEGTIETVLDESMAPYSWSSDHIAIASDRIYVTGQQAWPGRQVVAALEYPGVEPYDSHRSGTG